MTIRGNSNFYDYRRYNIFHLLWNVGEHLQVGTSTKSVLTKGAWVLDTGDNTNPGTGNEMQFI